MGGAKQDNTRGCAERPDALSSLEASCGPQCMSVQHACVCSYFGCHSQVTIDLGVCRCSMYVCAHILGVVVR